MQAQNYADQKRVKEEAIEEQRGTARQKMNEASDEEIMVQQAMKPGFGAKGAAASPPLLETFSSFAFAPRFPAGRLNGGET